MSDSLHKLAIGEGAVLVCTWSNGDWFYQLTTLEKA